MNLLFAASECTPFIKTGGLGDVIGALPKTLLQQGINVNVILPKYGDLSFEYKQKMTFITSIEVPVGWRTQYCGIEVFEDEGISYYFLDNEYYFKRHGSYGFFDDGERFAFFSRAVLEALPHLKEKPDIIHCHDWQTGPIAVLLKAHYKNHPFYRSIRTVFTIHNLKYQGIYPKTVLADLLDLSDLYFHIDGLEFHGQVNYLKAGLAYSDILTTVSPSYAAEIQLPYYGEDLDGFLKKRHGNIYGIINGIDHQFYDPKTDQDLFPYEDDEGKRRNKISLQQLLHLPIDVEVPIVSMVTRLVEQKGLDLVVHIFHELIQKGVQFILLGTGEETYERIFADFAYQYPENVCFQPFFDETLAKKIYAGSDLFLMPSKFEPCGIGQLIALRYGTLPIVRETGGLRDTVVPYNEFTDEGYGFTFTHYNAHDLLYTLERALWFYHFQPMKWKNLVKRAMNLDFSWGASAKQYIDLYEKLTVNHRLINVL